MPARSIRRCETICASLGFSRKSGRKYWDRRITTRRFAAGVRGASQSSSGRAAKKPAEAKKPRDPVRRFAYCASHTRRTSETAGPEFREVSEGSGHWSRQNKPQALPGRTSVLLLFAALPYFQAAASASRPGVDDRFAGDRLDLLTEPVAIKGHQRVVRAVRRAADRVG